MAIDIESLFNSVDVRGCPLEMRLMKYGGSTQVISMLRKGKLDILQSDDLRNLIADMVESLVLTEQKKKPEQKAREDLNFMVAYIVCGAVIDGLPLYTNGEKTKGETAFDRVKAYGKAKAYGDPAFKSIAIKLSAIASIKSALKIGLSESYSLIRLNLQYQYIAKAIESNNQVLIASAMFNPDEAIKKILDSKLKNYLPRIEANS